jgi:hypothetical protein
MDVMLNRTPRALEPGEAEIHFGSPDVTIIRSGSFVRCAVTGQRIPIEGLRYWSAERQEAYASADVALKRWKQLSGRA